MADTYSFLGFYCLMPPRDAFALATSSVEAALDIEPELAEAHVSFGLLQLGGVWDWDGAARAFKRAIDLDPANALARTYLSWVRVLLGDLEEAQADAERAQDIDPLSPLLNAVRRLHVLSVARLRARASASARRRWRSTRIFSSRST